MTPDPVKNPMTAVRALVVKLGKGRTLRERVRDLRWRRVRVVKGEKKHFSALGDVEVQDE